MTEKKNQRSEIIGWLSYDWANHAFFTLVLGVLIADYITGVAQTAVGENGPVITIGGHALVTAKSLYSYSVAASVMLQVLFLPFLGAVADYTHLKKPLLAVFCYIGAIATAALYFTTGERYLAASVLFIFANLGAGASVVFFNSYLIDITTEDRRDKVSSWSFAAGYFGGFTTLIVGFALLINAPALGMTTGQAARFCFLFAGIWWGGFAIITLLLLKKRAPLREAPEGKSFLSAGLGELAGTFRELWQLPQTLRFLIAYLLYNDGIQTVIAMAALFLGQELFVAHGMEVDKTVLFKAFFIAQFVAFIGSLVFERIAHFTSTKTAIIVSLVIWSLVVIYGYAFLHTIGEAYIMSGAIGFVLGGSQALSRSLFSQMIPQGREAAFFGIYAISERGTSWIGPIVFGLVAQLTDSYRPAILALIVFFVVGVAILFFVNVEKAIHDAGNETPAEAGAEHA
ncbi:MAG TPA: MFS transporter [Pyrinomonadaceae bacterium]|nr:MFS transporter [Pyrinomonadaceae bacterium]